MWIFSVIFLWSSILCAAVATNQIKPSIVVNHIKAIKSTENLRDELYFDISVYRAKQPTQYFRIPEKPFHWVSDRLDEVSGLQVWSQPIKAGETVTVIISLIEMDALHLNPDDLIGLMRVKLKNDNGVLQAHWDMPNQTKDHNKIQKFELSGDNSRYEVDLSLKK
jgi:hypothetical protein